VLDWVEQRASFRDGLSLSLLEVWRRELLLQE